MTTTAMILTRNTLSLREKINQDRKITVNLTEHAPSCIIAVDRGTAIFNFLASIHAGTVFARVENRTMASAAMADRRQARTTGEMLEV